MRRLSPPLILAAASCFSPCFLAQQVNSFAGDFAGELKPFHLRLHLLAKPDGSLAGTMDSPDAQLMGMPISDIRVSGNGLSFSIPKVNGL